MYQPVPLSDRTKALLEAYRHLPVPMEVNPYVDKKYRRNRTGDRWTTLGYLRGWRDHARAETSRMRLAYAEAEELYEAQPVFLDGELLAGHLYLPDYTEEEQKEYDALCDAFAMSNLTLVETPPRKDHICLDYEKLLKKGLSGIRQEICDAKGAIDLDDPAVYPDYDAVRRYEYYQCLLIELDAVSDLAKRYAEKAAALADEAEGERKEELSALAAVLHRVPEQPAETFYEAVESVHFFLSNLFGLYPLGRPDRYLYPYYERDRREGRLTRERAQELIDNFCLGISDRVFSRAACGFIVGGQDENGNLVENELTYMFLTSLDHLRLPDPNGALAVNEKTSDDILRYCVDILSRGVTHPAFYNDEVIVRSLIENYHCEKQDAVSYIHTTCAEISVAGRSRPHTTNLYLSLPQYLLEAADKFSDCGSYEDFYRQYIGYLTERVKSRNLYYILRMLEASRNGNEPMRIGALVDHCIERGKSLYEGGEKYTFIQPVFIGFATTVDSLNAIKTLVYDEKRLSFAQFLAIVKNDYEGQEPLRQYIINRLPHYGNDTASIDGMAALLANDIKQLFKKRTLGGSVMMPGTFSYNTHASAGKKTGATFDGRKSGTSYSDGCCAVQGRDIEGPTAMIRSLTSWDQKELLGGMVVNIKFRKEHLTGKYAENFITLLRIFLRRGGIEMQVNAVDRATLLDAREHPERHGDLIVRIGGYSDYFTRLSDTLQNEIIMRTEY